MAERVLVNRNNLKIADLAPTAVNRSAVNRYTLNALCVTRQETVVTNGDYLVRVSLPKANGNGFPQIATHPKESGDWEQVLIPTDVAKDACRIIPKKQTIPILNNAMIAVQDERVIVAATDLDKSPMVESRMVDGNFPNWKACIPETQPTMQITLSANYLAQLCKSVIDFKGDRDRALVRLQLWSENKVIRLDASDNTYDQQWMALLMPVSSESFKGYMEPEAEVVPDCFADVPEPEEVTA
jgi:DNA polymerase III beta subunit-like protein